MWLQTIRRRTIMWIFCSWHKTKEQHIFSTSSLSLSLILLTQIALHLTEDDNEQEEDHKRRLLLNLIFSVSIADH